MTRPRPGRRWPPASERPPAASARLTVALTPAEMAACQAAASAAGLRVSQWARRALTKERG